MVWSRRCEFGRIELAAKREEKAKKKRKRKRLPSKTISTTLSQPALFMYSTIMANKHVLVNIV